MLAIVIAVSYAYIAYYARQSEVNVLRTDCMKIEFKEKTNAITLSSAIPISDEEGYNTRPYIFEITNTCGVGMNYNVNLEVLTIKEGIELTNLIESKNIATKIDDLEVKKLTSEIATTPTYDESDYKATESYMVYTGVLNPGETKSHEIRVWLHYSAGNETQNKNFYSKVVIEGIQNEVASLDFSEYIMNKKDASIEEINHEATEQTPTLTDYRYVGANPNNYVYFGCDGSDCTSDNLYRIIGVIPTQSSDTSSYKNRVKLIKSNYYMENESGYLESSTDSKDGVGYSYDKTNGRNDWSQAPLNIEVLNGVYWNSLGEYQKYIDTAKWHLGAIFDGEIMKTYTPNYFYTKERSNTQGYNKGAISYVGNIGLMYPSDYGYSIGIESSDESVYENQASYILNTWLHNLDETKEQYEWTITPEENSVSIYGAEVLLYSKGWLAGGNVFSNKFGIRPTFYLNEDVIYVGGSGSIGDPYRIGKKEKRFSDYIIAERLNDNSIQQIVHEATVQTDLNASIDYRYTGPNPNNYVCFGSEESPCSSDNLYRIIGVIPTQSSENGEYENRVKLIKANYYTETSSGYLLTGTNASGGKGYQWNAMNIENKWEETQLNKKVLNEVYWNSLGEYQKYIEPAKWYLGAPSHLGYITYKSNQFYDIERSNTQGYSKGTTSYINNIGLMYPSDYGYSVGIENSNQVIYENKENYKNNSWLLNLENEKIEWTIIPEQNTFESEETRSWTIYYDGRVHSNRVNSVNSVFSIRPTFYLKSDVFYSKGDGTQSNPYRIGL